jgi:hypothetical protein
MDFTGGQMVLTLKLIAMAVSYQDTHEKKEEVRHTHAGEGEGGLGGEGGGRAAPPAVVALATSAGSSAFGVTDSSSTAMA